MVKVKLAPKPCAERIRLPRLSDLEMRSAPMAKEPRGRAGGAGSDIGSRLACASMGRSRRAAGAPTAAPCGGMLRRALLALPVALRIIASTSGSRARRAVRKPREVKADEKR